MDNSVARAIALLIAATLAGCTDAAAETDDRRVCPSCKPAVGGESFDFDGQISSCALGPATEITAEEMATFGVDAALARIPGSLRASLHWAVDEDRQSDGFSGFQEHSSLVARISLGAPVFRQGVALLDASRACPDGVTAAATVSLSTADGALVGVVLQGGLRIDASSPPRLFLGSDLADAYGSLDLQLAAEHHAAGSLDASLTVAPEGLSGGIAVWVEGEQPIAAEFPDPSCAGEPSSDEPASCAADDDSSEVELNEVNQHPPKPPEAVDASVESVEYEVTTEVPLSEELLIRAERECDEGEEPEAPPPSDTGCTRYYFDTLVLLHWCVVPDADSFDDYEQSGTDGEGRVIIDDEGKPIPDVPRGVTPVPGSEHCEADGIETGPGREAGYYPSKFCLVPGCEVER